jgi:hypothetical protein
MALGSNVPKAAVGRCSNNDAQTPYYSITSSARASNVGGMSATIVTVE